MIISLMFGHDACHFHELFHLLLQDGAIVLFNFGLWKLDVSVNHLVP